MANTKAEIVDAAIDDGLITDPAEAEGMTKADLLGLWWGG